MKPGAGNGTGGGMVAIDGSAGEGGGQILRTSLALSLVTGRGFRIVNIRAGRRKPGILRQHLTAILAATEIGGAACDGAEIGSRELVFRPELVRAGDYHFAVGTAGSTSLVLQTVLPALALADSVSRLTLEGGTHNPLAPPFDFLERTFLPAFRRFCPRTEMQLVRAGFYPAGGGKVQVTVHPGEPAQPLDLRERGADVGRRVVAHVASLPPDTAERAFERIIKRMNWSREDCAVEVHPADCGPGFVLVAEVRSENVTEVFTGFGERGKRAEDVADGVVDQARRYLADGFPVGEYLADQLLLPMALTGRGVFRTAGLSRHASTNIEVIEQFLPVRFRVEKLEGGGVEVQVAGV